jgi:hypothetical protein
MKGSLEFCQAIMEFAPKDEVDFHAQKQLKRAFYEYKQAPKLPLASTTYVINDKEYDSLILALVEEERLDTGSILFYQPKLDENWDYNVLTKTLTLIGNGVGYVDKFDYDSFAIQKWDRTQHIQTERVMIRAFLSRFYYPRSIKTKSKDPHASEKRPFVPKLITLEELWSDVREKGLVPFEIRVCAYTRDARFSYDLNLIDNLMLKDFRGGQVPPRNKAERNAMDYMNFDMILASTDMKDLVKKVFINLFEVKEATAFDISHTMGITDNMARNGLDAVVSRNLADKVGKPPREIYSINTELLGAAASELM